jgi:dolichol-phosphate mannosyltransferase
MQSDNFNPLIVVPVFNAENAILNVCRDLCENLSESQNVVFLDNRSTDDTVAIFDIFIKQNPTLNFRIVRNELNLGLGGSQKKAFDMAISQGYSHLIVFHGDGQPSAKDLTRLFSLIKNTTCDAILGSRFMKESARDEYSHIRTFGNKIFNLIFSVRLKTRIHDIGSGLNAYRLMGLTRDMSNLPNDLSFNSFLLVQQIMSKERIVWMPISWKNGEAGSNLKIIRIGVKCLTALLKVK